jgi:hypothetical protein
MQDGTPRCIRSFTIQGHRPDIKFRVGTDCLWPATTLHQGPVVWSPTAAHLENRPTHATSTVPRSVRQSFPPHRPGATPRSNRSATPATFLPLPTPLTTSSHPPFDNLFGPHPTSTARTTARQPIHWQALTPPAALSAPTLGSVPSGFQSSPTMLAAESGGTVQTRSGKSTQPLPGFSLPRPPSHPSFSYPLSLSSPLTPSPSTAAQRMAPHSRASPHSP